MIRSPERLFSAIGMDPLEFLAVRFYFGGVFFNDGKKLHYLGGKEELSFIDRDKIFLPKVMGHLRDHYNATDPVILHWLFPGKQLVNGLRVLVDDQACLEMCQCISDVGAADIFVELIAVNGDDQSTDLEKFAQYLSSLEQVEKDAVGCTNYLNWIRDKEGENKVVKTKKLIMQKVSVNESTPLQADHSSDMDSESDRDYLHGDDESSEEDEEQSKLEPI
jgi:alpha-galactosidase